MKKRLTILFVIIMALGICSCSLQKKPVPPPAAKPQVVPETSRVTFRTIELQNAPKMVRDMAKVMEGQDYTSWAQLANKTYILISQGGKSKYYEVKVDDVLNRITEAGFNWLDVKLVYTKRAVPAADAATIYTVVEADVAEAPKGVGFMVTDVSAAAPSGNAGQTPKTTPPAAQVPQSSAAVIKSPAPNQEISSPVKVQGTAADGGRKRIRISTRTGQIIKETGVTTTPGTGNFSADIQYNPPGIPSPGEITLLDISGGGEKVLARVPVVIK
ncbi:MAG: Gmad2 immunoglobulin-like domain-containing protein [Bacillota bacterium]